MIEQERERFAYSFPEEFGEAYHSSSLVRKVVELETIRKTQSFIAPDSLTLPLHPDGTPFSHFEATVMSRLFEDEEMLSLKNDLFSQGRWEGIGNKPTEDAFALYAEYLTSDKPILGKIAAASPQFQEYMKRSASCANLGIFFQKTIKELATGNHEAVDFFLNENGLDLMTIFDFQKEQLERDLWLSGKKRAQRAQAVLPEYIKASNKFLDLLLNSSDASDWRRFLLQTLPLKALITHSVDEFDPEAQFEKLHSLFQTVPEEQWDMLSLYFNVTPNKYRDIFDQQILNGDFEKAWTYAKFEEILDRGRDHYDNWRQRIGNTIPYAWANRFVQGKMSAEDLLKAANGWGIRMEALASFKEKGWGGYERERDLELQTEWIMTGSRFIEDAENIAQLIRHGYIPNKEIRKRLRNDPPSVETIQNFAEAARNLKIKPYSYLTSPLKITDHWLDRFSSGEIGPEQLKVVTTSLDKFSKISSHVNSTEEEGRVIGGIHEYLFIILESYCKSDFMLETDFWDMLAAPDFFVDMIEHHQIIPTPPIMEYLYAHREKDAYMQLAMLREKTKAGRFDPSNEAQRDLEFYSSYNRNGNTRILGNYYEFRRIPFIDATVQRDTNQTLAEKDIMEAHEAAIEAAQVYWLVKEKVGKGREVLVVGNERYGKRFVTDPLIDDLESLGVRVESTYVHSGNQKPDKGEDIFSEELVKYIRQYRPDIFIVDGTKSPFVDDKVTPKFPRSMIAFKKWFEDSGLEYSLRFVPIGHDGKVVLNGTTIESSASRDDVAEVILVNSTGFSHPSNPDHIPAYFDDVEGVIRTPRTYFTRNGLIESGTSISEQRFVLAVQREMKEAIPLKIMSPESDPRR